jgi:hypothetical protein
MRGIRSYCFLMVLALGFSCLPASAQTDQFLPEVDVYYKLNSDVRISLQAKQTREGGDPNQGEIGPSLDFYLKPLIRLAKTTEFDLNDAKSRPLVLSVGYRYLPQANGGPATNRMEPVATVHFPLKGTFLLTDRSRADLDWKSGSFTWRYRNRSQLEKAIAIRSYHLRRMPAQSSFTRANTENGAIPQFMPAVSFQSANTCRSTPTMSTRTTRARAPTSN